jgi:uncharacterized protein YjdB
LNPDVVTIEQGGWAKVNKQGSALIQAYLIEVDGTPGAITDNLIVDSYTASSGIYLQEFFLTMQEYQTYMLEYFLFPDDLIANPVQWKSDNPAIADVSQQGMVVSYSSGQTRITASVTDVFGNVHESSCLVTVHNPVETVSIEAGSRILWVGESYALNPKVYPPTASLANDISYKVVSDNGVASVNPFGVVTAIKPGKEIIAVSVDEVVAHCYVTVLQPVSVGITLTECNVALSKGQSRPLAATVIPYTQGAYPIAWTSSDESVATVTSNGVVLALSEGEAFIRATTADGWNSNECLVHVTVPPLSLFLKEAENLTAGQPLQLAATILPHDATIAHRPDWGVWEVEDESVLAVDGEFGIASAKTVGTTRVIATIKGTNIKDTVMVTVVPPYAGVHLSRFDLTLDKDQQAVLTASGASGFIRWTSDAPDVVAVDANGNLHAKAAGTAVITASDAASSSSCTVTVKVYADAVFVLPFQPTVMNVGDRFDMTAVVVPQEAESGSFLWSETGSSLLTLVSEGNSCTVVAQAPGVASFYVASPDGKAYASWLIHITDPNDPDALNVPASTLPSAVYGDGVLQLRHLAGYAVTLGNLSGKTLARFEALTDEAYRQLSLPAGVYFLRAQHRDGRRYAVKFIAP